MRKIIALLSGCVLAVLVAACGEGASTSNAPTSSASTSRYYQAGYAFGHAAASQVTPEGAVLSAGWPAGTDVNYACQWVDSGGPSGLKDYVPQGESISRNEMPPSENAYGNVHDLTFITGPGFARAQSCGLRVCGRRPADLCTSEGS
jgi:hypothetical protein